MGDLFKYLVQTVKATGMKLSKAQQEVVDRMREGWTLVYHGKGFWTFRGIDGKRINEWGLTGAINALGRKKVIFEEHGIYRLTEQYKNEQK